MPPDSELAIRLQQAREQAGLKQEEVAARLGVHPQTISDYERGKFQPRESRLKVLADLYGTTVAALRYGAGDPGRESDARANEERKAPEGVQAPGAALEATLRDMAERLGYAVVPASESDRRADVVVHTPDGRRLAIEVKATPPQEARVIIQRFLLEMTEAGATDEELDYVRRTMTAPEVYVLYQGGRPRTLTPDETVTELNALAEGLRVWLRQREKIRGRTAAGEA